MKCLRRRLALLWKMHRKQCPPRMLQPASIAQLPETLAQAPIPVPAVEENSVPAMRCRKTSHAAACLKSPALQPASDTWHSHDLVQPYNRMKFLYPFFYRRLWNLTSSLLPLSSLLPSLLSPPLLSPLSFSPLIRPARPSCESEKK